MIAHSGIWRPGMKASDTDGRLLDLRTGRYRRIPFQEGTSLPGCFLKGRTEVAISGVDPFAGVFGLYEVDLKTGENRRLGGERLASGFTLMPALSPDGKTLAVLHKGSEGPHPRYAGVPGRPGVGRGQAAGEARRHGISFLVA